MNQLSTTQLGKLLTKEINAYRKAQQETKLREARIKEIGRLKAQKEGCLAHPRFEQLLKHAG